VLLAITLLAVLGCITLLFSWILRRIAALPSGQIIYIDDAGLERNRKTLFDPELGLAGRPDYLIRHGKTIFPLEVKSGSAPSSPHRSHILQLGAYCHLVEVEYGAQPTYGAIRYDGATFRIDYSNALKRELKRTIDGIREMGSTPPNRSHHVPPRCAHCGYREICDQSLSEGALQRV
jgi:CRISPR-associated exonuclease Cas4